MNSLSSLLMSAKQQKCCAVQQMLLMDFLQTKKKKSLTTSQRCRNPSSSHVLSAFLVEHEMSAASQDGRFKFSTRASRGLSSTLLYTQAADRISSHRSWLFSQSEQIKSEHPESLMCSRKKQTDDLHLTNTYDQGNS